MKISDVSKKYDIPVDTLRYYEKINLIPAPKRKGKNRDYDDECCGWIEFIKCMRNAGMEIAVLQRYVELYKQGDSTIEDRKNLLKEQREKLRAKKEAIEQTISRLNYKIDNYNKVHIYVKKEN